VRNDSWSEGIVQNPLWDYASTLYGLEGVAPACLVLQDRFGIDVNLLMYAAWLARLQRRLGATHVEALDAFVSDWRDQVVRPLRTLRRQLHAVAGASEFYDGVKALELQAEREQLDRMYAFFLDSRVLTPAGHSLWDNLQAVAAFACPGEAGWEPAIGALVALIPT
jgi:uncharacterized protein (TIGR02444 family)